MMASMSASERALYFFGRRLVRCVYRVTALGADNLPDGGFLLLPNHITWVDAIVLQLACPRPIRYIIDDEFYRKPILHPFLRLLQCIPIDTRHSHSAIRAATEKIAEGEIVCLFPEGQLERAGTLLRLRRGYELVARHAAAAVVPVWLDQLWGSIFSFQGGRFFTKLPKHIPYPVTIAFGKPIEANAADIATVREELLKLGEFCYSRRPSLDRHLAEECVRGLKRRPFATAVIDGIDHSALSRAKLLGAAAALSRYLRKEFPVERIAIVLPASKGSMLANLAVTLAAKVPVDLNFTMGRAANETPNRSLVDNGDPCSGAFALAAFTNSKGRRSRGGSFAFYKRKHGRTKRCSNQPPQRRRKCLAVSTVARREERGRHSRVPAVFPHLRIDRHTVVSAYRRRAHCYLSKSVGSHKERGVDRKI